MQYVANLFIRHYMGLAGTRDGAIDMILREQDKVISHIKVLLENVSETVFCIKTPKNIDKITINMYEQICKLIKRN